MNLIDEIDKYLVEREGRERVAHHPSDSLVCNRQLYYRWKAYPMTNPPTPGNLLKMEFGKGLHQLIYEILKARGIEIIIENEDIDGEAKEFFHERLKYPIHYTTDGRFWDIDAEKQCVCEIKTGFGHGVKEVKEKGMYPSQFAQTIMYMYMEGVTMAHALFFDRGNAYRFPYIIECDSMYQLLTGDIRVELLYGNERKGGISIIGDERFMLKVEKSWYPLSINAIVEKLCNLELSLDAGIPGDREYIAAIKNGQIQKKYQFKNKEYKCWQCSYCYWGNECWKNELEEYKNSNNAEMFWIETPKGWIRK